jgi:hypothetical protein
LAPLYLSLLRQQAQCKKKMTDNDAMMRGCCRIRMKDALTASDSSWRLFYRLTSEFHAHLFVK